MEAARIANPDIVRLWTIGGVGNVVRWIEVLAAALFTLDITGSGFAVAAVTAARSLPMLLFGALTGVLCDAVDRKWILQVSMAITALTSLTIGVLACTGAVQVWHIALAAFVSGVMWSTDLSARRRMVGEAAAPGMISRVIALDSLSGSLTRMIGPMLGGVAYDLVGLGGAYGCTTLLTLGNALLAWPIRHRQVTQSFSLARIPRDLAEGIAVARREPVVLAVLGVTISMNLFAFSYSGIVAPIARMVFEVPTAVVGALAAAEPLGAMFGGAVLARTTLGMSERMLMLGGSMAFVVMLSLMPLAPEYWLACAIMVVGGVGTAGFNNMQTTIILTGTPVAMRSRLLGLTSVCMGAGPFGLLLIGALSDRIGPMMAVQVVATAGIVTLLLVNRYWASIDR